MKGRKLLVGCLFMGELHQSQQGGIVYVKAESIG